MLFPGAQWMVMAFLVCISGTLGHKRSLCVPSGSSVNLSCLAEHTSEIRWYAKTDTGSVSDLSELAANGDDKVYRITEEDHFTLTITNVRESDGNMYCCGKPADKPHLCWNNATELHVADLQVKVFPTTNGQAVTLMCSTSCPLTESPAAFVWYKNREFLYEDWSPWYQELVTSEEAVKYSCAIKAYMNVRAPEVSVDSVTPTCFSVTYAGGRLCSHGLKSGSCSITYAKDVRVQLTSLKNRVTLRCITSCPAAEPHAAFQWYFNRHLLAYCESQDITVMMSQRELVSCAVKGHEALHSDEICINAASCQRVNYASRRICALEGSSINISSVYATPWHQATKLWYKILRNVEEESGVVEVVEAAGRVEFHADGNNQNMLGMSDLKRNDSAEYMLCLHRNHVKCKRPDVPGVMLIVTALRVMMTPSTEVTEGQRVTLTCSTSCPLAQNITYFWFLNKQNLILPVNRKKHVLLDPASIQDAGNYSCAVSSSQLISSPEQALTVKARVQTVAMMNAVKLAVFVLILLVAFKLMTSKRKSVPADQEQKEQSEQADRLYEGISLMSTNVPSQREQAAQHEDML